LVWSGRLLNARTPYLEVDAYHRVHTPVTSLKRELRGCLTIGGKPLVSLDISNCQPLLLSHLVLQGWGEGGGGVGAALGLTKRKRAVHPMSTIPEIPTLNLDNTDSYENTVEGVSCIIPPDVRLFASLCKRGRIYEYFVEHSRTPTTREKIKRQILQAIYGRVGVRRKARNGVKPKRGAKRRKSSVAKTFEREFPNVWRWIIHAKRKNYKHLAHRMQKLESRLMIRGVCGRLMKDYPHIPVLTIHDALLVPVEHVDTVATVIREVFGKAGICPTLKIEGRP
jgi:hypothetical protein